MIRGFYTATSGLISQQTNLDIVANNMANSATTGFKPQHAAFSSLLHERINGGAANQISMGHGVKVQKTDIDFTQGTLNNTNMTYDYAILGDGFFALENGDDRKIFYSRDGSFKLKIEGSRSFLTDARGNYVLDSKEKRIEVGDKYNYKDIGVFTFPNSYGLEQTAGNGFIATDLSGRPESVKEPDVKQGYLENSSVSVSLEMVKMIEASKGFSFNSKIVQTADEMEKTINQLR
jgi:flagellar basal-body rod protein FlgG